MAQDSIYAHHIIKAVEEMYNERLSQDQYIELFQMIEKYRSDRIVAFIAREMNRKATSKQPVINQLPPTEETLKGHFKEF